MYGIDSIPYWSPSNILTWSPSNILSWSPSYIFCIQFCVLSSTTLIVWSHCPAYSSKFRFVKYIEKLTSLSVSNEFSNQNLAFICVRYRSFIHTIFLWIVFLTSKICHLKPIRPHLPNMMFLTSAPVSFYILYSGFNKKTPNSAQSSCNSKKTPQS